MAFAWDTRYYPSRLEYQQALLPFAVPAWIKGVTIHHTYKPAVDQWRGQRTMDVLERFYRSKGWSGGPHLFLAPDGLWAGTPLAMPGIHAGKCNSSHIGLEIVGDYDRQGWDVGLRERIYQLVILLLHWAGLTEHAVLGHRECLKNKSCPGNAIDMAQVRHDLHGRIFDRRFVVGAEAARVRSAPRTNAAVLRAMSKGANLAAHPVRGAPFHGNPIWARVKLPSSATGYIWDGLGSWENV